MNRILPLLLALAGTAGGARAETGVTDRRILVGSCSALSGKDGYVGQETVAGADAYISKVNAAGGIYGRKIELLSYDHKYDPQVAITCFRRLMDEGVFVTGFMTGTPTLAKMAPLAQANKIPMIGIYTGAEFLSNPVQRYIINIKASYQDEVMQFVERLWRDRGVRRIGIIYQSDALGATALEGVKRGLAKFGAELAGAGSYDRVAMDVADATQRVLQANPEVVFLGGSYVPSSEVVKRLRAAGWKGLFAAFTGTGVEGFVRAAGQEADGTVITLPLPLFSRQDLPATREYTRDLKKYYPQLKPTSTSFEGYVDAMVLVEGLKRAGRSPTRENFVDAVDSIHDLDIGLGKDVRLNFSPENHKGFSKVGFVVVRDGKLVSFSDWKTLR